MTNVQPGGRSLEFSLPVADRYENTVMISLAYEGTRIPSFRSQCNTTFRLLRCTFDDFVCLAMVGHVCFTLLIRSCDCFEDDTHYLRVRCIEYWFLLRFPVHLHIHSCAERAPGTSPSKHHQRVLEEYIPQYALCTTMVLRHHLQQDVRTKFKGVAYSSVFLDKQNHRSTFCLAYITCTRRVSIRRKMRVNGRCLMAKYLLPQNCMTNMKLIVAYA